MVLAGRSSRFFPDLRRGLAPEHFEPCAFELAIFGTYRQLRDPQQSLPIDSRTSRVVSRVRAPFIRCHIPRRPAEPGIHQSRARI